MTTPPLPDTPCLRVALVYTNNTDNSEAGSRFFVSYAGSAPTGSNCGTLATDIAAAWASHIAPLPTSDWALTAVDVLDIATYSGASGSWSGSNAASGGTHPIGAGAAINVEFDIARRYRGGKPRMFFPGGDQTELADSGHWSDTLITAANTGVAAFFAEVVALSVGAVGALSHVNLSYFSGFTNHSNTSGRERAVPTYRATALHDEVTGYAAKRLIGSQRRRRAATTP